MRFSKGLAAVVLLAALLLTGLVGCGLGEPPGVAADRAVLEAIYHATGGPQWNYNENWLSNKPLGEWYGVGTDNSGRVAYLGLHGNNLSGPIPSELGNLSSLRMLKINTNQFRGNIPTELGNLSNLEYLSLFNNQLTGPIPPELGNLSSLEWAFLCGNQLSGTIPPELANLSSLEYLNLFNNQLTGHIPIELGNLPSLKSLSLGRNRLTGLSRRNWATCPTSATCPSRRIN